MLSSVRERSTAQRAHCKSSAHIRIGEWPQRGLRGGEWLGGRSNRLLQAYHSAVDVAVIFIGFSPAAVDYTDMSLLLVASTTLASRAATLANFDRMISACALPPATIEFINDPKMRTIFHGIAAANAKPEVKDAFAIVYQDLGPVRMAGNIIFARLERLAVDANNRVDGIEMHQTGVEELATARRGTDADHGR